MENLEKNKKESREDLEASLEIRFSKEDEVGRIKTTISKFDWYKKEGYTINLPDKVRKILEEGRVPTGEEVMESVFMDFDENQYKEKTEELRQKWEDRKDEFLQKLSTLGLPLQSEYKVLLTKYGVGGSYGLPNKIILNLEYGMSTAFHEMIHLTIEELIKKHTIDHWTKERLVDLTYSKFFPDKNKLQKDPERSAQINEIFERSFPDIEKVISEIGVLDEVPKAK